jgi:multiple sugar transport system ATP-binding protein
MTVRQNMAFALENLGHPKPEVRQRVDAAAEMLQIGELLQRRPRELSGGQRQRVALGRAIVRQPHAFLFDEPLSNLDASLRSQMRVELAELHRRLATTSLYVTHDQVEAMTLGQRIFVMDKGVIQQAGTAEELYDRPANAFVASFIGSPPMNVFGTEIVAAADGPALRLGGAGVPVPERLRSAALPYRDRAVRFGLRPEHIAGCDSPEAARPGWTPVDVEILIVENLGSEKLVHFKLGEHTLVAKMPAEADVIANGRGRLALNLNRIHLFDPETTLRLSA